MADEAVQDDAAPEQVENTAPPAQDPEGLGDAGKQALDRMKAERNAATSELKALRREFEKVRQSQMTEAERAVAEAEARGRQSAHAELGKELVKLRFDAMAGRRNPDIATNDVLEFVDLSRFLGEDGRPDEKALQAAVERLVPAPQTGPPSFEGGARTTAPKAPNMDALIRRQIGARVNR